MAKVDLPAPLIPVSTIEASGSNILTEAKSEPGRGELGAEREAVSCQIWWHSFERSRRKHAIPLAGELFEVRGEN